MAHDMDSDAGRRMIEKGVSGAMRYARKHSGLSIAFLHDLAKQVHLGRVSSEECRPDILTKPVPREALVQHKKILFWLSRMRI